VIGSTKEHSCYGLVKIVEVMEQVRVTAIFEIHRKIFNRSTYPAVQRSLLKSVVGAGERKFVCTLLESCLLKFLYKKLIRCTTFLSVTTRDKISL
ncbi:hypothetical protein MHYMCMPSP_00266, partial [Hyalomma marginatum]